MFDLNQIPQSAFDSLAQEIAREKGERKRKEEERKRLEAEVRTASQTGLASLSREPEIVKAREMRPVQQQVYVNKDTDSDKRIRAIKAKEELGTALSPAMVENDLQAHEKSLKVRNLMDGLDLHGKPVTARILSDPIEGPTILEDAPKMLEMETWFKGFGVSWRIGQINNELLDLYYKEGFGGGLSPKEEAYVRRLQAELVPLSKRAYEATITDVFHRALEQIPLMLDVMFSKEAMLGLGSGALVGAPTGIGAIAGAGIGYATTVATLIGKKEAGGIYEELGDIVNEDGKRLPEDVRRGTALVGGIVNGALEAGGGLIFGKVVGGMGKRAIKNKAIDLVKDRAFRRAAGVVGVGLATGSATNAVEEALQETTTILAVETAKDIMGVEGGDLGENLQRVLHAAEVGAKGGFGIAAVQKAPYAIAMEAMDARRMTRNAEMLKALGGHADTELLKKFPKKQREYIKRMAEEHGAAENVTVPVEALDRFMQEADITGEEFAEVLPQLQESYAKAKEEGGEVSIPYELYATTLAKSKVWNESGILEDVRPHPEMATDREKRVLSEDFKKYAETYEAESQQEEFALEEVQQHFLAKIGEAKPADEAVQLAELLARGYMGLATRAGIDVETAMEKFRLDVAQEDLDMAMTEQAIDAIQRGEIPTDSDVFGPTLQEAGLGRMDALKEGWIDETVKDDEAYNEIIASKEPYYKPGAEDVKAFTLKRTAESVQERARILGVDLNEGTPQEVAKALSGGRMPDSEYEGRRLHQGPRGYLDVSPNRDYFKITLTGKADLSTFIHESGHMFIEMMTALAMDEQSLPGIKEDLAVVHEYLGVTPEQGGILTREQHEKWARSFEAYFMTNEAPTPELRNIFRRFASWLVEVYKSHIKLGVELTPEVTEVMDRMLASEESIKAAQAIQGKGLVFNSAEHAGMSQEAWRAYLAEFGEALEDSEEKMRTRMMKELSRRKRADYKQAKAEIENEVTEDVEMRPVFKALTFLRTGFLPDTNTTPGSIGKLDRAAVKALFHNDSKILTKLRGITVKNGADPDITARYFGYKTAHEMLTEMLNVKPMKQVIKEEVAERLEIRFGKSKLGDIGAMSEEASRALHSKKHEEFKMREMRLVHTKAGRPLPAGFFNAAREYAEERVAGMSLNELSSPLRFQQAEKRAAKAAFAAAAKNDWEAAAEAQRKEVLNSWMYRKAVAAQDEISAAHRFMKKLMSLPYQKRLGLAGHTYLDSVNQVFEKLDLKKVSKKELGRRASLEKYLERMEEEGQIVQVDERLTDVNFKKNYSELTLEELRAYRDSLKNIYHLAQLKNKLLIGQDKRNFARLVESMSDHIRRNLKQVIRPGEHGRTAMDKFKAYLRMGDAGLSKAEFIIEMLDGTTELGMVHEYLYEGFATAQKNYYDEFKRLQKDLFKPIQKMIKVNSRRMKTRIDFLGEEMPMHSVLAVALNVGNKDNLRKLASGYNWDEQDVLDKLNELLTKEDWQMVEHVWKEVNRFWDDIAALHKKYTGLAPPKVEGHTVKTPHGDIEGMYYPVIYDPHGSYKLHMLNSQKASDWFEGNLMRKNVSKGFTEGRVADQGWPLYLSLYGLGNHMSEVVHYLTHYEAVHNAYRLLNAPEIQSAIDETLGQEYHDALISWVKNIAGQGKNPGEKSVLEPAIRHLATGTSIAAMAGSTSTMLVQMLGLTSTAARIGYRQTIKGMAIAMTPNGWGLAQEKSKEIPHLMTTFDRDGRSAMETAFKDIQALGKLRAFRSGAVQFGYRMIGSLQYVVSIATWLGAYDQGLSKLGMSEKKASEYADSVVRKSQSAGGLKDLAGVQRQGGAFARLFTCFYGFFSALYGQLRNLKVGRKGLKGAMSGGVALATLLIVPQLLEKLMRDGLPEDEDPEEWLMDAGINTVLFATSTVPGARDILNGYLGGYGYEISPVGKFGNDLIYSGWALRDWAIKDEDFTMADFKKMGNAISTAAHLPLRQVIRSAEYYDAYLDGTIDEPFREFIFGVRKK